MEHPCIVFRDMSEPAGFERREEAVILPGSFDPPTLGHLEVIRRAAEIFPAVYVTVFQNPDKHCMFTPEERAMMLASATDEYENVLPTYSLGFVADYAREHKVRRLVKGYRGEDDIDYEISQAEWNYRMGGLITELWLAPEALRSVSSTEARRRLISGEPTDGILSPEVLGVIRHLREKKGEI